MQEGFSAYIMLAIRELFNNVPLEIDKSLNLPETSATGIVSDSRKVQPGNIFVAMKGLNTDGHKYIPAAIDRGAVLVVGMDAVGELSLPYVQVEDSHFALAYLCAAFHQFPARKMTMIGVTGTDGKTTTANLIYQIMIEAGISAGIISTVNAVIGEEVINTGFHVTTPEAPDVQRYLSKMLTAGVTHVVLEATSHGLAQHRVTACEFDVAVITNITHEHLDYHGSSEAYWEAKFRLFRDLAGTGKKGHGNPRLAVLNLDDHSYDFLKKATSVKTVSYSAEKKCSDISADNIQPEPSGLYFDAVGRGLDFPVFCHLIGAYNVSNCLAAIAVAHYGLEIPVDTIRRGIKNLQAIPGRMEQIDLGQDFLAVVDFAHTPNALLKSLETARKLTKGNVLAIFGSAGLRDREKRFLMAEISADLADLTFLTAEDPRTESLEDILREMGEAVTKKGGVEGKTFWRIPDRGEAIKTAVRMAAPGDIVISLGKGHEQSMCFGEIEYSWDDRKAMRAALAEHLNIEGHPMPYLPAQDSE